MVIRTAEDQCRSGDHVEIAGGVELSLCGVLNRPVLAGGGVGSRPGISSTIPGRDLRGISSKRATMQQVQTPHDRYIRHQRVWQLRRGTTWDAVFIQAWVDATTSGAETAVERFRGARRLR